MLRQEEVVVEGRLYLLVVEEVAVTDTGIDVVVVQL